MRARIELGDIKLTTRNGHDWAERMPRPRATLAELPADNAWIDGEAVALDASGKPDLDDSGPRTRAYVERRTKEGMSKKEIHRCLTRYIVRELYPLILADLADSTASA
uniref:hypothetical protein n=1 Tax=Paraburkholderia fungorum TaxID=134537 RepID=UPI0038B93427